MIASANILTDIYLSLAGLLGLSILHWQFAASAAATPLTARFIFVLRVGIMLFAGRALVVLTGGMWFRFVVILAAALIPLATVLLTESMLRRHAPKWVKAYVVAGATAFGITAFWLGTALDPVRLYGLLGFQLGGFAIAGWLIVSRDRASLSEGENRTAHRLGLALLFLVPLGASDFLLVALRLPVQVSVIGVLMMCWLALGLGRVQDGHSQSIFALLLLVFAALLCGGVITLIGGFDSQGGVLVIALILATLLVLAIIVATRDLRDAAGRASILGYLAQPHDGDVFGFLQGLSAHPLMSKAVVIAPAQLDGFDHAVLTRIFAAAPVLRRDLRPALGDIAEDHMAHLFERFDATHLLDPGTVPRQIVAISVPAFLGSNMAQSELGAVQRMAALIAQKRAADAD